MVIGLQAEVVIHFKRVALGNLPRGREGANLLKHFHRKEGKHRQRHERFTRIGGKNSPRSKKSGRKTLNRNKRRKRKEEKRGVKESDPQLQIYQSTRNQEKKLKPPLI